MRSTVFWLPCSFDTPQIQVISLTYRLLLWDPRATDCLRLAPTITKFYLIRTCGCRCQTTGAAKYKPKPASPPKGSATYWSNLKFSTHRHHRGVSMLAGNPWSVDDFIGRCHINKPIGITRYHPLWMIEFLTSLASVRHGYWMARLPAAILAFIYLYNTDVF